MSEQRKTPSADPASGLVVGGQGGPESELLESGQEEVFSRTEVETGRIEHKAEAGSGEAAPAPSGGPRA
jgi:hypothetical protein